MKITRITLALVFAAALTASASLHAQSNQYGTVAGVNSCIQQGAQGASASWTNTCPNPVTFELFGYDNYLKNVVPVVNQVIQPGANILTDPRLSNFIYFVCPSGYTPGKSDTPGLAVDAQTTSYQCFPG